MSIIKEAWEHRREDPRQRAKREQEESEPIDRRPHQLDETAAAAGVSSQQHQGVGGTVRL